MAIAPPTPPTPWEQLTASVTGPEMVVSPPGASWEKERKTFRLSRSGPALAQGEKKVMMEVKEGGWGWGGDLPDGTCLVPLKSPKNDLKGKLFQELVRESFIFIDVFNSFQLKGKLAA